MEIYKYKNGEFQTSLEKHFKQGEKILKSFDIFSLDHKVNDPLSMRVLVTQLNLVVTYDDVIEIYKLGELDMSFNEVKPQFNIEGILFEGNFNLSENSSQKALDIRNSENRVIFTFQEGNTLPKDILLRKEGKLEPNFKTWAMGQTIINAKNGVFNRGIDEMLNGYFTTLDPSIAMKFIYVFLGYFFVKLISVSLLPNWLDTIVDVLFWIVLGIVVMYMYKMVRSTLSRYEKVYLSYKQ